ncbi:UNVERIFIED_CONTAM: hypothetical protein Sindi_2625300, partial [Sesamum indicum]
QSRKARRHIKLSRAGERRGVGISIGPRTYDDVLLGRDMEGGHDEGERLGCTECVGQEMGVAGASVVPQCRSGAKMLLAIGQSVDRFRDNVRDAKARIQRASASTWTVVKL